jgi:hypothetical protein
MKNIKDSAFMVHVWKYNFDDDIYYCHSKFTRVGKKGDMEKFA